MKRDKDPALKTQQPRIVVILGGICIVAAAVVMVLVLRTWFPGIVNAIPAAGANPGGTSAPDALASHALYPALTAEFVHGACSLGEDDNPVRAYRCDSGKYHMLHKEAATRYAFYRKDFDDAIIEAEGRLERGTGNYEYGIVFRANLQGDAYYVFTVTQDGRYNVSRYETDKYIDLIPYTASPLVRLGQEPNKFKVIMRGRQFEFYLNDQYLDTVTDGALARGVAGLFFYNKLPNAEISFDQLTIETFSPPN